MEIRGFCFISRKQRPYFYSDSKEKKNSKTGYEIEKNDLKSGNGKTPKWI